MGNTTSPLGPLSKLYDASGALLGLVDAEGTLIDVGTASGSSLVFPTAVLSASAVVKGVAGDPGNFIGVFCVSVSGGKVTIRDGGTVSGALIPGLGSGGASGLALTAGQYLSLGAPVYCANGIYLEISGTASVVVLYQ